MELTHQPYAGFYLFFLLFEDNSDDHELMIKAFDNCTDFDFRAYLISQGIDDPSSHFDANRVLKLRDKMSAPAEVGPILEKVITRFKHICRKNTIPSEMIKQNNLMLLESAINQ